MFRKNLKMKMLKMKKYLKIKNVQKLKIVYKLHENRNLKVDTQKRRVF